MASIYSFDDDLQRVSGRFPFFDEDKHPVDFNSNSFYRFNRTDKYSGPL